MSQRINLWLTNDEGQTFVEYALILAVVVVGVLLVASWTSIATAIQAAMNAVTTAV